jgi:hypothetical protein
MKANVFKVVVVMQGVFIPAKRKVKCLWIRHKDGIVPSLIEQVANVFELAYGEVKE